MKGSECLEPGDAVERVVCMPDGSLLNRYWGSFTTPRPEAFVEDEETAHESEAPPEAVYRSLRAAAESGWDFSSRWLTNPSKLSTIETTNIVPVDLNCLLWYMEQSPNPYIAGMTTTSFLPITFLNRRPWARNARWLVCSLCSLTSPLHRRQKNVRISSAAYFSKMVAW